MKDQITSNQTVENVETSPRARRRAKIYKLLESMYLDKEEPVCIQHWYRCINIKSLIRFG